MIEVKGLTKRYGEKQALTQLSFQAHEGEIVALLGSHGAGKTTALDLLAGVMEIEEGTVLIHGKDMASQPADAKEEIGYMTACPPLYDDMTVRGYLKFICEAKLMSHREVSAEIGRVLQLLDLADTADYIIKYLSEGTQRRLALAQALINNPKVLLLDEPTHGMDPKDIIEMRSIIRDLGKDHAILLATGNLTEALALCSRALILADGRVVAQGDPHTIDQMSMDTGRIRVLVKGREEQARAALAQFPAADLGAGDEEGTIQAFLPASSSVREDIFHALAKADLPILYMAPERASLEQVILSLENERFVGWQPQEGEDGNEGNS